MTLLAGTTRGLFTVDASVEAELDGDVTALGLDDGNVWTILDGSDLYRFVGEGWAKVAVVSPLRANCLLPAGDIAYVGTSDAHLLLVDRDSVRRVESFETMDGREDWYTPWGGGPPDVRSFARAPAGEIFANVHVGGIARSADEGRSWEPTIDIHSDVHQVVAGTGSVVAATALGLAVSSDSGDTWDFYSEGLHATYARAVTTAGDVVLMSVSQGPRGGRAAVYRFDPADRSFRKLESGLPEWIDGNIDTHCLIARQSTVALGTEDGSVYMSEDGGETWGSVASDLPPVRCLAFAPE